MDTDDEIEAVRRMEREEEEEKKRRNGRTVRFANLKLQFHFILFMRWMKFQP